jgi:hypothetical protein
MAEALLFDEKICQSMLQKPSFQSIWVTPNSYLNIVPTFFGGRFVGKEIGLLTYKPPSSKLGDSRDWRIKRLTLNYKKIQK